MIAKLPKTTKKLDNYEWCSCKESIKLPSEVNLSQDDKDTLKERGFFVAAIDCSGKSYTKNNGKKHLVIINKNRVYD